MYTWSVRITYIEGYGDGSISEHYYVSAENDIDAIDKVLTSFLDEYSLIFDKDIENIEWSYCRV